MKAFPPRVKCHRADEHYDEVSIRCVERYKTSGLSGNEWRFSYQVEFKRKGQVCLSRRFNRLEWACMAIPYMLMSGEEGSGGALPQIDDENLCCQPGCGEEAISTYQLKSEYSRDGFEKPCRESLPQIRKFCGKHLRRGDCALEDADANYTVIEGLGPGEATHHQDMESPSAFGGII